MERSSTLDSTRRISLISMTLLVTGEKMKWRRTQTLTLNDLLNVDST